MRWIEVSINTPAEEIEARCEAMTELGIEGFSIENEEDFHDFLENNPQCWDYVDKELEDSFTGLSRIRCYLSDDEGGNEIVTKIKNLYPDVQLSYVDDSDWENDWKKNYEPVEAGERLVVIPQWEEAPEGGRIPIRLEPGLIFGTGSHPTTKMCLALLEKYSAAGKRVLDLGCGSGILGIGTLVLGCESCIGCDIASNAPEVVASNAALNDIGENRYKVCVGDIVKDTALREAIGSGYDIVLANIVSDVIIPLAAYVKQLMKPDGVFITSGIIDGREDEVAAAITAAGLKIIGRYHEDEWNCFECKLSEV